MALDLRRLMILREVARQGSVSGAARTLWMTQPAVSRQIAALEAELGRAVLDRLPRGVRPTEAGQVLVAAAEAILARAEAAEVELAERDGLALGRVRIATFATAGATFVAAALAHFRREHRGVEVRLREALSQQTVELLRTGEVDVAVTFEHGESPDLGEFERTLLLEDRMYAAVSQRHRLAARKRLRLGDLADEDWIHGQPGTSGLIYAACLAAGFEPRIRHEAGDSRVINALVASGLGVTLVPGLSLGESRRGIAIRPIGPQAPVRRVVALARQPAYRSPAASEVLRLLQQHASDLCSADARLSRPSRRSRRRPAG